MRVVDVLSVCWNEACGWKHFELFCSLILVEAGTSIVSDTFLQQCAVFF
jgi:hypothetical protein